MTLRRLILAATSAFALALSAPALAHEQGEPQGRIAAQAEADARLVALFDADQAWSVARTGRSPDGEGGFTAGDRLPRVDPASQQEAITHAEQMLAQLDLIPAESLSDENRIHAAVFRTRLETVLLDGRFREWEAPFNSDSSFWTYLDERGFLSTEDDYRRYLARMRDIPRYFAEHEENMRAGLARGFSIPRVTIEGRDTSITSFITDPEASAFYAAFRQMPSNMPAEDQARLRDEARAVIREVVVPAYEGLLAFYRTEYLPQTRTTTSAADLPDGEAYYAAQVRKYTTLDITPDEVRQIGLWEVARIQAEMRQTMRDAGFEGSFEDFLHFLRTDPQFYAETPEELLMVSAWVAKRVDGRIGDVLGRLPRRRFTIVPVPDALAPFYTAGRGGLESCQMNTHNLPSRPLYQIPALTLHECSPGHSLQAALAEEQEAGPEFRRYTYFSGYGEGWGLYTEWLGVEMGIYRTPYEHFGRLSYEMWRAARLVIDTGLHQQGWSRRQAIDYLAAHTALSQHEVETEVDRYISWPGQALSYKLGELTIRRLRREAEAALGSHFDLRRFHDAILALGSVPLPVLEARIERFIVDETARVPAPQPADADA